MIMMDWRPLGILPTASWAYLTCILISGRLNTSPGGSSPREANPTWRWRSVRSSSSWKSSSLRQGRMGHMEYMLC
jgi:hypothetical protein